MKLSERLQAAAEEWPTVYESDRANIALLREASALARRVEIDRAVAWQKRYAKIPRHIGDDAWGDWEQCSKLTHDNIQIGVRMGDVSRQARALVLVESEQ